MFQCKEPLCFLQYPEDEPVEQALDRARAQLYPKCYYTTFILCGGIRLDGERGLVGKGTIVIIPAGNLVYQSGFDPITVTIHSMEDLEDA